MKTNKFLVTILTMFIAVAALSACGPVYKTEYEFTAPPTEEGRACANHCLDALHSCTNYCAVKESECRRTAAINGEAKYFLYLAQMKYEGKEPEKEKDDFISYGHCSDSSCKSQCESSQRICHVNCGGQVERNRVCTAFCD